MKLYKIYYLFVIIYNENTNFELKRGICMKVTILGTGSIYSKSNCASLIIDNSILIDLGPGVVKQLLKQNYDLQNIDTILITHLHSDHILDFPSFIVNIEVLGIKHKINIYSPTGAKDKLLNLLNLMYGDYFNDFISKYLNFINIVDNQSFIINNSAFKTKEVLHTGIESYGFIVDSKLGITGDTSLCNGVKEIFNNTETIICDCSLLTGDIYHMGIDNIIELLKDRKEKRVLLTHFRDSTKKIVQNMNLNSVFIVEDGYTFILEE